MAVALDRPPGNINSAVTAAAAAVAADVDPARPCPPVSCFIPPSDECPGSFPLPSASTFLPISGQTVKSIPEHECPSIETRMDGQAVLAGLYTSFIGPLPRSPSSAASSHLADTAISPRSKGIPQRKSLSGLFGSAIRIGHERIRTMSSANSSPNTWISDNTTVQPRSLSSISDDAQFASSLQQIFPPYQDWLDQELQRERHDDGGGGGESIHLPSVLADCWPGDLRFVASANEKLSTLVSSFGDSPASIAQVTISPHHALSTSNSLSSLPHSLNSSPTPMRRIQSAMLAARSGSSPGTKRMAYGTVRPMHTLDASKEGPTLVKDLGPESMEQLLDSSEPDQVVPELRVLSVDLDSLRLFGDTATPLLNILNASVLPSHSPMSPREPAGRPPTSSLPPTPDIPTHSEIDGKVSLGSPSRNHEARSDARFCNSSHRDQLRSDVHEFRQSFDFDNEYGKLVRGEIGRAHV